MTFRTFAVASVGAAVVGSSASAAIISFSQQGVWNAYVAFQSLTVVTEDFNSIPDGPYASGYTDSAGPITWSASAIGDLFVQGGLFSTNAPETLTFQFSPGVQGVSGNFFGTDVNFNPVPSLVQVTLADGTSSILLATGPADFTGFFSTGAAISSLSIAAATPMQGETILYPTVDNLYFGIPAPGVLALLGAAGVLGFGLRRR